MKSTMSCLVMLAAVAAWCSPAKAQYGYVFPPYQAKAATAGESHARGLADLVRSQGAANLLNSQAAQEYEKARSLNFENRVKYAQMYFEKKRINQEYRKSTERPAPTQEQLFRMAKVGVPDRLGPNDLDPVSGALNWPRLLRADVFEEQRTRIEQLFAYRAEHPTSIAPDFYATAKDEVDAMYAELKKHIRDVPSNQYIPASKFLRQLDYELKF